MIRSAVMLVFALSLSLGACARSGQTKSARVPAELNPTLAATQPPLETGAAPPEDAMDVTCNAAAAQPWVGKPASDANLAAAKAAVGAKGDLRVINPGQPVTLDYRFDRLNVEVDNKRLIVKVTCG